MEEMALTAFGVNGFSEEITGRLQLFFKRKKRP
jgi:hypothetical protein